VGELAELMGHSDLSQVMKYALSDEARQSRGQNFETLGGSIPKLQVPGPYAPPAQNDPGANRFCTSAAIL
jgi:hypothetical protein